MSFFIDGISKALNEDQHFERSILEMKKGLEIISPDIRIALKSERVHSPHNTLDIITTTHIMVGYYTLEKKSDSNFLMISAKIICMPINRVTKLFKSEVKDHI